MAFKIEPFPSFLRIRCEECSSLNYNRSTCRKCGHVLRPHKEKTEPVSFWDKEKEKNGK